MTLDSHLRNYKSPDVQTPGNPDALIAHEIAQLGITLAIVAEHSFFLKKEKPEMSFKDSIETALDVYLGSSKSPIIMSTVAALDFSCLGLRKSPIRSLFNTTPAGVLEEAAIARVALHETLVKIVLDNRITRSPIAGLAYLPFINHHRQLLEAQTSSISAESTIDDLIKPRIVPPALGFSDDRSLLFW
ncbi:hypothetical protein H0H93_007266 [Arthromyces matolae]|nr:hypothetical protein H0H93_007266 [Arthromyces matolae]